MRALRQIGFVVVQRQLVQDDNSNEVISYHKGVRFTRNGVLYKTYKSRCLSQFYFVSSGRFLVVLKWNKYETDFSVVALLPKKK